MARKTAEVSEKRSSRGDRLIIGFLIFFALGILSAGIWILLNERLALLIIDLVVIGIAFVMLIGTAADDIARFFEHRRKQKEILGMAEHVAAYNKQLADSMRLDALAEAPKVTLRDRIGTDEVDEWLEKHA